MTIFLNNSKNILYIHVPKTGGEFISEQLSKYGLKTFHSKKAETENNVVSQHLAGKQILDSIKKSGIKNCELVVMTVRNPYDRLISHYNYRFKKILSLREFNFASLKKLSEFQTFNKYILQSLEEAKLNRNYYNNHFLPQNEFEILSPKVFKFEENGVLNLLKYIEKETYFNFELNVMKTKKSNTPIISRLFKVKWLKKTLDEVNKFYREDFIKYGYKIVE